MVFTYLHALMMLQRRVPLNDKDYIYAAMIKLSLLFFGKNYPHDQQLISNERKTEATMPCDLVGLKHFFLV